MGYELPDYCIFQGRWFDDDPKHVTCVRWSPWKNIEEWEYKELLSHIEQGKKYQVRILKQVSIKGFGVDKEDPNPKIYINPGY